LFREKSLRLTARVSRALRDRLSAAAAPRIDHDWILSAIGDVTCAVTVFSFFCGADIFALQRHAGCD
jgi:hypothetical protein